MIHNTYVQWVIEPWEKSKDIASAIWGANWDYFGIADHVIITLYSSLCEYKYSYKDN